MGLIKVLLLLCFIISSFDQGLAGPKRMARTIHWEDDLLHLPWAKRTENKNGNLQLLLHHLGKSPTGRSLVLSAQKKAHALGLSLSQLILPGNGSLTSTTLIRRFHTSHPEEFTYDARFKIFIDRELATRDAVLDLAHELTHFVKRKVFNPYSGQLSPVQFLTSTIEGKGGEVEAYITECKVLDELPEFSWPTRTKCHQIRNGSGHYSTRKTAQLFYQVGNHYQKIKQILKSLGAGETALTLISPRPSTFISSAHDSPYPLAALWEYLSMTQKACQNDQRRMALLYQHRVRTPASLSNNIQTLKNGPEHCKNFALWPTL